MVAYLTRVPAGIPGMISRVVAQATISPEQITPTGTTGAPTAYGQFGVIDATSKKWRVPAVGDVATSVVGGLVRPFPGSSGQDPLGVSTPAPVAWVGDIMRRGYMSVLLGGAAAAAKDGRVYIRKANASGGKPIGGVEAAADLGTTAGVVTGTGNGTWTPDPTAPVSALGTEGAYVIKFTSATAYIVSEPSGAQIGSGTITATAGQTSAVNGQIKGTITEGSTTFVTNDIITVTVAFNTILLPSTSKFTGPADTSGNTEIQFNL